MKILIAEDDRVSCKLLQRTLEKWGYTVVAARDGEEAWSYFQTDDFSLVISDWMMPGLNGPDLVRLIRSWNHTGYVYIILLTAKSQKEDIVAGIEAGADDYVSKPFDQAELHARLRAGERLLQLEQCLARRNSELEAANAQIVSANQRMKRDLQTAARIQDSLLPKALPNIPGMDFAWAFKPCDELAGDILNVFYLDEKHIGLYVLDVSSHGVSAALLAVTLSRLMSPVTYQSSLLKQRIAIKPWYRLATPSEVAADLNRQFPMQSETEQYFTLLYGILNLEDRQLCYVQAGHPNPLHVPHSEKPLHLECEGLPIGFVQDTIYQENRKSLSCGDRLYLYSDGITEAKNPNGEQFGDERMTQLLDQTRSVTLKESLSFLLERVEEWCGAQGLKDDVSLLALEIK